MKLTDYLIIFMMIIIPSLIIGNIRNNSYRQLINEKRTMNFYLDAAVSDGTNQLLSHILGETVKVDIKQGIDSFYNTLFINLGIENSMIEKNRVKGFIPVILIAENDGFTVIRKELYNNKWGEAVIDDVMLPKTYYTYEKENYIYLFTMTDTVTVIDTKTNAIYKGSREEVEKSINVDILKDEAVFDSVRRKIINIEIQKKINQSIENHNKIKKSYGSSYQFYSSLVENDDWVATIDELTMVVVFQGMPLVGVDHYYSNIAIGGAKLVRENKVYLQQDIANGLWYYHRKSCPNLFEEEYPVEGAKEGAKK